MTFEARLVLAVAVGMLVWTVLEWRVFGYRTTPLLWPAGLPGR